MRLSEIMSEEVETATPGEDIRSAVTRMRRNRIRHLVIAEGGRVVGVLSERDLGGRFAEAHAEGTVADFMVSAPVTATPHMTLREAANQMRGRSIGCLPVLDGDRIAGIVTVTDLLELLGRGAARPRTPWTRWKPVRKVSKAPRYKPVTARP